MCGKNEARSDARLSAMAGMPSGMTVEHVKGADQNNSSTEKCLEMGTL